MSLLGAYVVGVLVALVAGVAYLRVFGPLTGFDDDDPDVAVTGALLLMLALMWPGTAAVLTIAGVMWALGLVAGQSRQP